jgi:hypothetical protein
LATRGKKRTVEQRQRISEKVKLAMKGGLSDVAKQKISDSVRKRKEDGTYVAPMSGKTVPNEVRERIKSTLEKTNRAKSLEIVNEYIGVAAKEGLTVEGVDENYWFNFHCQKCDNRFTFSRQIFRPSAKNGIKICPTCNPRNSGRSVLENELFMFVKKMDGSAVANDRRLLKGKELDVYLPERKLAFEFTGLYWHAEKQQPENKHLLWKAQYAYKCGVRIVSIFEDEWLQKRAIVESRIKTILGLTSKTIYARKCTIQKVESKAKNQFLTDNHIQGKDTCSVALGLFDCNTLVALATFKKSNIVKGGDGSSWELSRFCSKLDYRVIGGASKLIKHFQNNFNSEKLNLISYADRRWSTGNLYETIGFKYAGTSPPSYWYTKDYKTRVHRSALMKHKLVKDPSDSHFTEWELAKRSGYDRIWDCGTTKWILSYS